MDTKPVAPFSSAVVPARFSKGFTLLEVVIVVIIMAVVAGMGLPAFLDSIERAEVKSAAGKVAAVMRAARVKAVSEKYLVTVVVKPEKRTLMPVRGVYVEGEETAKAAPAVTLSEDVAVWTGAGDGSFAGGAVARATALFEFMPSGGATAGTVYVTRADYIQDGGPVFGVRLDPLTGRVRLLAGEETGGLR